MLRPSGEVFSSRTDAPSLRRHSGPTSAAAPLAPSTTTLNPVQVPPFNAGHHRLDMAPPSSGRLGSDSRVGTAETGVNLIEASLDSGLGGVVEFEPAGGEELDPVVEPGIVRGRHHGPG